MVPWMSIVSPSLVWIPWILLPNSAEQERGRVNGCETIEQVAIHPQYLASHPSEQEWLLLRNKKILVMGSGQGSNFEALTLALRPLGVEVAGVFCDRHQAGIIDRARRLGVPVYGPPLVGKESPSLRDEAVLAFLQQPFDLLLLAGYMRILPPSIVSLFPGHILNVHPSLLPQFSGLRAIQRAWENKALYTGVTIHEVDQGVDTGTILAQVVIQIHANDTLPSLKQRIHGIEHQLYPWAVARWLLRSPSKHHT